VSGPGQLAERILRLREFLESAYRTPSFDACESCEMRRDLTCQGGCLGYKVGRAGGIDVNIAPRADQAFA
jgi:hypothetical protein